MLGALGAALISLAGGGCGSGDVDYANADRPPASVAITIMLDGGTVAVSPDRVGAGPVLLLIANESGRSRDVTLTAPDGADASCVAHDASSGPISPEGTARISLPLVQGTCEIGVADGALEPARLRVGAERPSAQQDLLQP